MAKASGALLKSPDTNPEPMLLNAMTAPLPPMTGRDTHQTGTEPGWNTSSKELDPLSRS
jgi:hypothetical protein